MAGFIADIWKYRELVQILIERNIKIRYKNSSLGIFWTLLSPLFLIAIYAIFLRLLKFSLPDDRTFLPTLVIGIIVWQFLAMCLGDSLRAITGNSNLITKTAFPRAVLPLAMVLANLAHFFLSAIVLVGYLVAAGMHFTGWIWLPVVVLTHVALCLGATFFLSAMNVFFRDTEHVLSVAMLAWFFLTPVIYPFELIPVRFQEAAFMNPMTGIIAVYRHVLMSSALPSLHLIALSFGVAWSALVLGASVFRRLQAQFAEEL